MSHWDGKNIVAWPSRPWGKRGWERIDCGCCGGICWGGEEPIECNDCNGIGTLARFKKTGTIALYPGGPFKGKRRPRRNEHVNGDLIIQNGLKQRPMPVI